MLKFKKYISTLIIVTVVCGLFSGCKIESPNDVARDILNRALTSSDQTVVSNELDEPDKVSDSSQQETSNQDRSTSKSANKPKDNTTPSKSASSNYMKVEDVKGSKDSYAKYDSSSSTSSSKSNVGGNGNTGGWNHDKDSIKVKFDDKNGDGKDDATGLDKYLTDPIPEGKPKPVEPDNVKVNTDKEKYCTLSIRIDTILNNRDKLDEELLYLLDKDGIKDGIIYAQKEVLFHEGESVFDVLLRETKANRIHMEFSFTPMYNSCYVEGMNNFYEFSSGELSGWMYKVNGWFPNYGCSRYQVKDGDTIEWVYTCDLGRDVGCDWLAGTK